MKNSEFYEDYEYAGFWARFGASIIDQILLALIVAPLLILLYGIDAMERFLNSDDLFIGPADFIISWVFPAVAVIIFWVYKSATPGKMVIHARIVDADTGKPPSTGQCIGRYFSYILSALPFGVGFLWVAFDKRKQGWHDKLAGTVVIKPISPTENVEFRKPEENRNEHSN